MSEDVILFSDLPTNGGQIIKRVVLNAPQALNALSGEMIETLLPALDQWEADDNVVGILLEGAGNKAFCAGGDIVQIYQCMTRDADYQRADHYFQQEYCLDYRLHTLKTPLITWADGVTMGGGLGLSVAGSHRVVTENTLMAMPEITIGLFPDVGSSWYLGRMPGRTGLFAGLTGAQLNADDALYGGLADRFLLSTQYDDVVNRLTRVTDWRRPHATINAILREISIVHQQEIPSSMLRKHEARLNHLLDKDSLEDTVQAIESLGPDSDEWLAGSARNLINGCPVTAHLVYRQLQRGRYLSLADCFKMELAMTTNCIRKPDFREGIRALLIDKDKQPSWSFPTIAEVPADHVEAHFTPTWQGDHPLSTCLP